MGACVSSSSAQSVHEDQTLSSRSSSMREKFDIRGPKPSKRIKQTKTRPVQKREKGAKPPQTTSFYPAPVSSPISSTPMGTTHDEERSADGAATTSAPSGIPTINVADASDMPAQPSANDLAVAADDVPPVKPDTA